MKNLLQVPAEFDVEALVENVKRSDHRAKLRDACLYIVHHLIDRLTSNEGRKKVEEYGGVPLNLKVLATIVGRNAAAALKRLRAAGVVTLVAQYLAGRRSRCYTISVPYCFQPLKDVEPSAKFAGHLQEYDDKMAAKLQADESIAHLLNHLEAGRLTIDMEAAHYYLETMSTRMTLRCQKELAESTSAKKRGKLEKMLTNLNLSTLNTKRQLLKMERAGLLDGTSRSSTNLRLHTPVVGLRKQLRSFLRYQGGELNEVDMGAAQPYLLLLILSKSFWSSSATQPTKVVFSPAQQSVQLAAYQKYSKSNTQGADAVTIERVYPWLHSELAGRRRHINTIMLSTLEQLASQGSQAPYRLLFQAGDFYENLVQLVRAHPKLSADGFKTRRQAKKTMMYLLFEDFNQARSKSVKAYQTFRALFPQETVVLDAIKKVKSNALAILLQRLEAVLMLEQLTKIIADKHPHVGLLTVHDAILTQREHAEVVRSEMELFFDSFTGVRPTVKVTELSGATLNEQLADEENDLISEFETLQQRVHGKDYATLQGQFITDESLLLRPHVPAWNSKTASTTRIWGKLFTDPARRATHAVLSAGVSIVAQAGLTTTSFADQVIQLVQLPNVAPEDTTWQPPHSSWEVRYPLLCLAPGFIPIKRSVRKAKTTYTALSAQPGSLLATTDCDEAAFTALHTTFDSVVDYHRRHYTLQGQRRKRALRELLHDSAFASTQDLLVCLLSYLKHNPGQAAHAVTFGLTQPQLNQWLHRALPWLHEATVRLRESLNHPSLALPIAMTQRLGVLLDVVD